MCRDQYEFPHDIEATRPFLFQRAIRWNKATPNPLFHCYAKLKTVSASVRTKIYALTSKKKNVLKVNTDFSNLEFFNLLAITRSKSRSLPAVDLCNFNPNFPNFYIWFFEPISLFLEVRKIGIHKEGRSPC